MNRLLNDGWSFAKLPCGEALTPQTRFTPVDLPHDFLIAQADNLYESCDGWYRRTLTAPADMDAFAWVLRFDGVYMDCDVLLNGQVLCTHRYGYTAFDVPLTGKLRAGENELAVLVRHRAPNSRWYSGAGIFRDVTLCRMSLRHIVPDGIYAHAQPDDASPDGLRGAWTLSVSAELDGPLAGATSLLTFRLLDAEGRAVSDANVDATSDLVQTSMRVQSPRLWSCGHPVCYTLEAEYGEQTVRQTVGFRHIRMTPDEGLFLNGVPLKLHGVCLHHDLGALGSAFHEKAARRQLLLMRKMGVNALRTSHNPPACRVPALCDKLGILMIDEAFDMWEHAKTAYDYARFFKDCAQSDVAAWVRRDRNHPCILMWSIGNEIVDTHIGSRGGTVTKWLANQTRRHDPLCNGLITIGSNYMPWSGAQRCAEHVEVVGYNYGEKLYEAHHREHSNWVIYGSETASIVSSRGVYRFPMRAQILSDEDLQCSALGNSCTSWGTQDLPAMIVNDLNTPYSLGQFLWAGIDYIGEPTPYHTRSCYFGMADTACFPKDFYFLLKALWTDEPVLHIGVSWDWNPGQLIDVPVMTNAASVELSLNGTSLGRKEVDLRDPARCRPLWQVAYAPGELRATAYDAKGNAIAHASRLTPGDTACLTLQAEDAQLLADGEDMTFVTISACDAHGRPVDNACDRVHVRVTGEGRLLGLDNGDSTDPEGYKTSTRRLFSGKLLAIVGSTGAPGVAQITVSSPGKPDAILDIPTLPAAIRPGVSFGEHCPDAPMPDERPVRKLELIADDGTRLNAERREARFHVIRRPYDCDAQRVSFRVTNPSGIDSPCAELITQGDAVTVRALGDGTVYLRACCGDGTGHPRVISQLELTLSGLGSPALDPYGFVSAGLYDFSDGDIGAGNEQGIAFARDGYSMVGFERVDFGPDGSDEVTLPIFALTSERTQITLYLGDPRKGGERLCDLVYQKPSRYNVYQSETYHLPRRLRGVQTLCFSMEEKAHLKGFSFARQSRAWMPLCALDADLITGDSFTRASDGVVDIGNNVTLVFERMDFGSAKHVRLVLDGATPLGVNPITLRIADKAGHELTALAEFKGMERGKQAFVFDVPGGLCTVRFIFLPGSRFDFYGLRFERAE